MQVSVCLCVIVSVGTLIGCVDMDDKCKNISMCVVIGGTLLPPNHSNSEIY